MFASKSLKVLMAGVFVIGIVIIGQSNKTARADKNAAMHICRTGSCAKLGTAFEDTVNCASAAPTKNCDFTGSTVNRIWCHPNENFNCTVIEPVQSNRCEGLCVDAPFLACYSANYSKCRNPHSD